MRDIVRVIDAVLAEIPADEYATGDSLRLYLGSIKDMAAYYPPECAYYYWRKGTEALEDVISIPIKPWQQRVADIWSGRTEVQP